MSTQSSITLSQLVVLLVVALALFVLVRRLWLYARGVAQQRYSPARGDESELHTLALESGDVDEDYGGAKPPSTQMFMCSPIPACD